MCFVGYVNIASGWEGVPECLRVSQSRPIWRWHLILECCHVSDSSLVSECLTEQNKCMRVWKVKLWFDVSSLFVRIIHKCMQCALWQNNICYLLASLLIACLWNSIIFYSWINASKVFYHLVMFAFLDYYMK